MARNAKSFPKQAKKVFQGQIFDVYQWEQELFDGSTAIYESLARPDSVQTVGALDDGKILMIEDEQPNREAIITAAGGKADVAGESPEEAAKREFLEETGYEVGELVPWYSYAEHSKINWFVYVFIGRKLRKVQEPELEAGERIKLLPYEFDDFLQLGRNEKLRDRMTRICLLEALVDKKKRDELERLLYG